jgi:hypothetical protein
MIELQDANRTHFIPTHLVMDVDYRPEGKGWRMHIRTTTSTHTFVCSAKVRDDLLTHLWLNGRA